MAEIAQHFAWRGAIGCTFPAVIKHGIAFSAANVDRAWIGSAVFTDGQLVPNTEFGHMEVRGKDAEHRASDLVRKDKELGWKKWAGRINEFLARMEALFSPDLFIIGGGVSKKHEKFIPHLQARADILPAELRNEAGIIGAALAAGELAGREPSEHDSRKNGKD